MEVSTKRTSRYRLLGETPDVQPVGEQSFFSRLADGYSIGAYGQMVDAASIRMARRTLDLAPGQG